MTPTSLWHVTTKGIDEYVRAADQFAAWDLFRDRPLGDFGLVCMAEPDENGDPILVHTSALLTSWGRDEDAAIARSVAMGQGLPNTVLTDREFAEARRV